MQMREETLDVRGAQVAEAPSSERRENPVLERISVDEPCGRLDVAHRERGVQPLLGVVPERDRLVNTGLIER